MAIRKLTEFLDRNNVKYLTIVHSRSYTSQEVASMAHVKGRGLAKTVIVTIDGRLAMAVVPAPFFVDVTALKQAAGASNVTIAAERGFRSKFPECETGALPPFGNLWGMPVFLDESLLQDGDIVFNAGTHTELLRLDYRDFARLVQPTVARFSLMKAKAAA